MAHVIMGHPDRRRGQDGQARRSAVEGLDLRLLIDRQDQRVIRRGHVKADDVADLRDELRVRAQLPRLHEVRLQPEGPPDPRDRRLRQARLTGHRPRRPVPIPAAALLVRTLVTTTSTCSSVIFCGAPGRGASDRPSSRPSANRTRHLRTISRETRHARRPPSSAWSPTPPRRPARSAPARPANATPSACGPATRAQHQSAPAGQLGHHELQGAANPRTPRRDASSQCRLA